MPTGPSLPNEQSDAVNLKWLIFLVAGAMFMENLDGTIITTALPTMARAFGRTAVELGIGISAYLIALGIFIPASGWVADRFGTRRTFACAIILFTSSSALCGLSTSLEAFVAVRIVQGMAGAMMVPVGRLVVLRHTPRERMMDAMATLVWPALVAPVLGPPLGGLITTHFGWRWIFYLNLPLGAIALAAAWRLVPDIRSEERRPFDWPGFGLCGTGTFALLSGVDMVVARPGPAGAALIGLGLLFIALSVRHFHRAASPMLELSAYKIPTFRTAMRGGSLSRMAIGSAPFLLPVMFQVGFHFSPEASGFLMLAVFGANLGMKTVTSRILRRFGFRTVLIWNGLLCAGALAACALLSAELALPLFVAILVVVGAARSMQFTTISMMTFADVPKARMSGANGLAGTISQLSMGAGIALGAVAVRLGHIAVVSFDLHGEAVEYRLAFLVVASVSLLGLLDAARLPNDAAQHFTTASLPK